MVKNASDMENHVFMKAKTKVEYSLLLDDFSGDDNFLIFM